MGMATNAIGVEIVREVKNDESEDAVLVRTDSPITVELGDTAGNPVYTEADHFLVVDVHVGLEGIAEDLGMDVSDEDPDEVREMFEQMGVPTEINEGVVAVSNEDGEVGHAVIREDGADIDTILDKFTATYL